MSKYVIIAAVRTSADQLHRQDNMNFAERLQISLKLADCWTAVAADGYGQHKGDP